MSAAVLCAQTAPGPSACYSTHSGPWWQQYIPTIVGFVQFVILAVITIFVFWSNAAQKIRERQADWYHKVVIDHVVDQLKNRFAKLQTDLLAAAVAVDALRIQNPAEARESSKTAIVGAKQVIFELRAEMGFRISAFDSALEQLFTRELETLENDIVDWFTTQPDRRCYEASASLPSILAQSQVQLLRILMRKEFSTWGFTWPWNKKGMLPPY